MTMSRLRTYPTSQIVFFCLLVAAACLPGTIAFAQGDIPSHIDDLTATTPVSQPANNTINGSPSSARTSQSIQKYENMNQQDQQDQQEQPDLGESEFLSNLVQLATFNAAQHTGDKQTDNFNRRGTAEVHQALKNLNASNQADVAPDGFVSLGDAVPEVQSELASIETELSNSTASDDFASAGGAQVPISFLPIYQNDPLSNYSAPSSAGLEGFDPATGQYFLNGNLNNNIGVQYPNTNISPPSASLCGQ